MKTVVVANQKGGVGKSTVACHGAFYFAEQGQRVLFIDSDSQGNSGGTLKRAGATVGGVASSFYAEAAFALTVGERLTVVEGDGALADVGRQQGGYFRTQLRRFAEQFDICIIDTPPSANVLQIAPLTAADYVLSPIELENYSMEGVKKMLQTILGVKQRFNPDLVFLGMLPNRLKGTSPRQKEALASLLSNYPQFVFAAEHGAKIGERQAIPEALAQGMPVWNLKKSSAREAAEEMQAIFKLVAEKVGGVA